MDDLKDYRMDALPSSSVPSDSDDGRRVVRRRRSTSSNTATPADPSSAQVDVLRDLPYPAFLAGIIGEVFDGLVAPSAYRDYLAAVVRDSGEPIDATDRMMAEQLVLRHLHIGALHVRAAKAKSVEAERMYLNAACRMGSEFRRLVLARREYRSPVRPPSFTVVKQANVAGGDQQIAIVDGHRKSKKHSLKGTNTQLHPTGAITDDRSQREAVNMQSAPSRREPAESLAPKRPNARRARKTSRSRAPK